MRSKIKKVMLAGLMLVLSPMAANADLIEYTVTGASELGWSLEGYVRLDDSNLTSGPLQSYFSGWAFTWTNGVDTLSNDSSIDSFISDAFEVDASFQVEFVNLCTNTCTGGGEFWPEIQIYASAWAASITPEGDCCVDGTAVWSGPTLVSVPEPGTLALFGIGLLGMGLARRKKV